jgi:glycosyltransferase involved in cell wall biosynthesis
MSLISIIVPAYNAEPFLGATLDSVLAQSHREWECIVVDDGSTDETLAVAERYAAADGRIRVLHHDNAGVSAARNVGFRASNTAADYCTFMDSDDVWLPGALETLLDRAQSDPAALGAHGLAEFIDEFGQPLRPGEYSERGRRRIRLVGHRLVEIPPSSPTDFSVLILGTSVFPPGLILVRRDAYLSAGRFDETLTAGEEWDMLVRLTRRGHLAFLPEVVIFYRRHGHNLGASSDAPAQTYRAFCQGFHSPLNSAEQQDLARRGWRATQRRRLREAWSEARADGLRSPMASARQLAVCGVTVVRILRGHPRPVIHRDVLSW